MKPIMIIFLSLLLSSAHAQINGIKIIGDPCTDLTLAIQVTGTSSSPYFFWDFGDPSSGTNDTITITGSGTITNPVHTFSAPGLYTVCATFQEPGQVVQSVCDTFSILLCCSGIITATDSCLKNSIAFQITTDAFINSINWNFDDTASGISNTSSTLVPSHQFSGVGNYMVSARATAPCGIFTATYLITIKDCSPIVCNGNIVAADTCINIATNFTITQANLANSVSWNFGDTASGLMNTASGTFCSHQFTDTGTYYISAQVNYQCGLLVIRDTLNVIDCTTPVSCQAQCIVIDSCIQSGISLAIILNNTVIDSVHWNFGQTVGNAETTTYEGFVNYWYTITGNYTITAEVYSGCGVDTVVKPITIISCVDSSDRGCAVVFPSAFSPNGDGVNDYFKGFSNCSISQYHLHIYNRWGELVYETMVLKDGWDGSYKNLMQPMDTYVFIATFIDSSSKSDFLRGSITLIR